MRSLREVRDSLLAREKKRIAVAAAEDRPVLEAVKEAVQMGIAEATLCGDEAKIRQIAEEIELDVNKVTIVNEPDIRKSAEAAVKLDRLILMTDAAMVMYPTLEEKIAMINNTIPVCQALEIEDPKAAAVCAVEVLNPSMQPTLDAASLAIMSQRGQFKGITVDGPLALDNALNEDAARHKGIKSPVAGHADVLLMPNIECGNIMWKTLVYMARCEIAGVLMGAAAPVVITSRSDAPETKLNSIALALLIAGNKDKK